jgi:hypothetical protein
MAGKVTAKLVPNVCTFLVDSKTGIQTNTGILKWTLARAALGLRFNILLSSDWSPPEGSGQEAAETLDSNPHTD